MGQIMNKNTAIKVMKVALIVYAVIWIVGIAHVFALPFTGPSPLTAHLIGAYIAVTLTVGFLGAYIHITGGGD